MAEDAKSRKKVDALADLAPEKVIEMYAERFPQLSPAGRVVAIEYLRHYANLYYSPAEVPEEITGKIDDLEVQCHVVQ